MIVALTDQQRQAILDEIIVATTQSKKKAYQYTNKEYRERAAVSKTTAQRILTNAVENGSLKTDRLLIGTAWTNVYWRPEDEPQGSHD